MRTKIARRYFTLRKCGRSLKISRASVATFCGTMCAYSIVNFDVAVPKEDGKLLKAHAASRPFGWRKCADYGGVGIIAEDVDRVRRRNRIRILGLCKDTYTPVLGDRGSCPAKFAMSFNPQ